VFLPDLVVRSRRVVTSRGTRPGAIHIRNGRIIGIVDFEDVPSGCPLDEASDASVLPGLVDSNVHVNEPDRPDRNDWEGFESATRAAAAGGVTTIVDMPLHGVPATTTVSALDLKRRAAEGKCFVDVGFWGGVVPDNARELAPLFEAGVLGFTCVLIASGLDEFPAVSEADLRVAMPALTQIGATLLAHAELAGPIEAALERQRAQRPWFDRLPWVSRASRRYATFLESRPKAAENEAVALLIQLCREYRTRTHIVHLSSSDALAPLFHARAAHLPITAETCPHYLYFVADEIPSGATAFKCAPPIRERENREFLWAALAGGLIQMVVSGHSTPPPALKHVESGDFMKAWAGIASLQLGLSIMWTGARDRGYTLGQVVQWMCLAPARLSGLDRKGALDVGYDADLVVFDPDAEFIVEAETLVHRHRPTPYLGRRLRGSVCRTYLRGKRIYERGTPMPPPSGNLLTRGAS
jgi:allantoinase